jgi:hypothetical protein
MSTDTRTDLQAITKEIGSLRGWLDFLERDLGRHATGESGVISGVLLASIGDSCTNLLYYAGIVNGVALHESQLPIAAREAIKKAGGE